MNNKDLNARQAIERIKKVYKNMEKPGYRSIDVRVFLLYYIIYRTADRVELRIVYRNKSKKT